MLFRSKCTPCGTSDHQTNDIACPQRIAREKVIRERKPEQLTPYFITAERWTWDRPSISPTETFDNSSHQHHRIYRNGTRHGKNTARPSKTPSTLHHFGLSNRPTQTGANSIPLNTKKTENIRPTSPSPSSTQVRPPSPQCTNTIETPTSPLPPITPQ